MQRRGRELGRWDVTAIPDAPPVVAWAEPPGAARGTRRLQTRLPWTAADDYGVVSVEAELRLKDRPAGAALVLADPVARRRAEEGARGADAGPDGEPVGGLAGRGRAGREGCAGPARHQRPAEFVLPERQFKNPLARP